MARSTNVFGMRIRRYLGSVFIFASFTLAPLRAETNPAAAGHAALIQTIAAVGSEGSGNVAAGAAWRELAKRDLGALLPILNAMDSANELAANWLRSAVETMVNRELASGRALPVEGLEQFVLDRAHQSQARRLAFELIAQADPARSEKLLAGMINDPGSELRREAVGRELGRAGKLLAEGKTAEGKGLYQRLLTQARDVDQVDGIVKALRKLGETVDVAKAFGFITEWKVIGPFDSAGGKGFAAVYPPELGVDLGAEYDGKAGKVRWQDFASKEDYGEVSMNLPMKALKGVAAYAYTEFYAPKAGPAELRLGSENAFKVWVNGNYLFGQDEYHRLKEIDQYPMRANLKAGKNEILVKVCQNEQTEDWASGWDFQLRVCDLLGATMVSAKGEGQ